MIRLSILMGSVGDRLERMCALYAKVAEQAAPFGEAVEILVLTDNRCRSIGMKRQALLDVSQGDYVCFLDDDDDVEPGYVPLIMDVMPGCDPDVFTFPTWCKSEEFGDQVVEHSIAFENEEAQGVRFRRKPWMAHPTRRELAITSRFPDCSWGEDTGWLEGIWPYMKNEVQVTDTPLYVYHWDDSKPNPDKP